MTADLSRAAQEVGEVVRMEHLGGGIIELTARLPHLATHVRPGEFAQLRCAPGFTPLLRRPFSVAWTEEDLCSFVFEVVGAGTRLLAGLREGDLLDSLGPLGSGFTVERVSGTVVCISGGLGCAPFPILGRALRNSGVVDILVLNGAATAARLYPAARFQRGDGSMRVLEATDDGSRGKRGRITELASVALSGGGVSAVYACGPNPMLQTLAAVLERDDVALPPLIEASFEAPMGCGFGTCLGCALPVRAGEDVAWALCCSEGPVLPMRRMAWGDLAQLPPANVA